VIFLFQWSNLGLQEQYSEVLQVDSEELKPDSSKKAEQDGNPQAIFLLTHSR
jgi:hypothetical protein